MILSARTGQRTSDAKDEAMAEVTAEPTKRLNVEIPATLRRRVNMAAAVGETTIVEIVTEALEEYLDNADECIAALLSGMSFNRWRGQYINVRPNALRKR